MIPQETIEQVREASDIVQVIGEFLRLKKRGRNFLALCPFHIEKTPSFNVSPEKQIFHCFGCGKGGNVYTFLMEHEKMSFVDAVRFLARRANITIREDRQYDQKREVNERIAYANAIALEYFCRTLKHEKYTNVRYDYLVKKRGLTEETIDFFRLGLSTDSWDGLITYAKKKDLSERDLYDAGLATYSEEKKKYWDKFRQRLMIPIYNLSGTPIAFGGRTLKKGETIKYMNSPETPLYSKSNVLYGLNFARDYIRSDKHVYVVEGYFDFISLWQIDVRNVVASSGTAFTAQQARLLSRFAEEVYLFFDADSAGYNAAVRSVDALYDAGLEVKVVVAPEGEDPDSVSRKGGADRITELKENAMDYVRFRVRDVNIDEAGIIGREKLVKELAALGEKISDPTRRDLFLAHAASALQVEPSLLRHRGSAIPVPREKRTRKRAYSPVEKEFLSLLFCNPGSLDDILNRIAPDDFDSRDLSRLYSALSQQYRELGAVSVKKLIDQAADPDFAALIADVAAIDWPDDSVEKETKVLLEQFLVHRQKNHVDRLRNELAEAERAGDVDRAQELLEEIQDRQSHAKKTDR